MGDARTLWTRLRDGVAQPDTYAWLLALWAALYVLRGHVPFIQYAYEQNADEGYMLAVGQRMLHGRMLPFVDGVAHTGPLYLYSGALIAAIDQFSWLPVRIVAATCFVAMTWMTFLVGRQAGRPFAGALAAVCIPVIAQLRFVPNDGIAYNAETPVVLGSLGAMMCIMRAVGRADRAPSLGFAAGAGVLASCAALSKQVGALQALALAGGMCMATLGRPGLTRRQRTQLLLWFAGGTLLPVLLIFGWQAINGGLEDAYYYLVTYNTDVYMFHVRRESRFDQYRIWFEQRASDVLLFATALIWGAVQAIAARNVSASWREAMWRSTLPVTVTALAFTGLIGARASTRDFAHYYLLALPWFSLLAGMLADTAIFSSLNGARWQTLVARIAMVVPLVLVLELAWSHKQHNLLGWSWRFGAVPLQVQAHGPQICQRIQRYSKPGDRMFVWGFRPELYISCKRLPASRYVFSTFPSGVVPWFLHATIALENQLSVPGSREILIRELEETKAPVVVDVALSLGGRSMTTYPETQQYLKAHYKLVNADNKEGDIWVRRSSMGAALATPQ